MLPADLQNTIPVPRLSVKLGLVETDRAIEDKVFCISCLQRPRGFRSKPTAHRRLWPSRRIDDPIGLEGRTSAKQQVVETYTRCRVYIFFAFESYNEEMKTVTQKRGGPDGHWSGKAAALGRLD